MNILEACTTAVRQWRMYHSMHEEHDIEDEKSTEGDLYRLVMEAIAKHTASVEFSSGKNWRKCSTS